MIVLINFGNLIQTALHQHNLDLCCIRNITQPLHGKYTTRYTFIHRDTITVIETSLIHSSNNINMIVNMRNGQLSSQARTFET